MASLFLLASTCGLLAAAGDFDAANQLFDQGKFSEAKARYENLAAAGDWSANLFYNLGNCEYRLGSPGKAILEYERALTLDPSHPEALANLAFLRSQTGSKIPNPSWQERLPLGQPMDVWAVAAAIAGWLAAFALAAILTAKGGGSAGHWLIAIASLTACAYGGSALWLAGNERNIAIVTAKTADARLAPADTAAMADTLPAGSRVRVLSERGDWIYCELPGRSRGWVPVGAIEKIRSDKT